MLHGLSRHTIRAQHFKPSDPLHLGTLRVHGQVAVFGADAAVAMVDGTRLQVGHLEAEADGAAVAVRVVPLLCGGVALAEDGFDDVFWQDGHFAGGGVEGFCGIHGGRLL